MSTKYDFSGYVTKNNLRCSDGRTIIKDAFKENDGTRVPLVYMHDHSSIDSVIGHADLENRSDGVYGYCYLNNTPQADTARELVVNGDIDSMSIYANQLVSQGSNVVHGSIKEVSLVLAGANPGAKIDSIAIAHADGSCTELEDEAVITIGANTIELVDSISHSDEGANASMANTSVLKSGSNSDVKVDPSVKAVMDTLNDDQRKAVSIVVSQIIDTMAKKFEEGFANDVDDDDDDDDDDVEHYDFYGNGDELMHTNVFDNDSVYGGTLTHDEFNVIMDDAKRMGSLKDSFIAHSSEYGIDDIDILFPDARNITETPTFIKRRTEWVAGVLDSAKHSPFSRIKTTMADITEDEARAKGYIKGNKKKEEVFKLLKRVTTPTTIYKKQKLDRDDITDITDLNVVAWMKAEMRLMLDEEIARAMLVGDGRDSSSEDKINEESVRPIWTDDDLFTMKLRLENTATTEEVMESILRAMDDYEGTGLPTMYTTQTHLTDMLLLKDKIGRRLYTTVDDVAKALGVGKIVAVPVLKGLKRSYTPSGEASEITVDLYGVIVNLADYTVGADKGGEISMFDDFDIDYNQYKYLLETRCSGCLTLPKSALAVEVKTA